MPPPSQPRPRRFTPRPFAAHFLSAAVLAAVLALVPAALSAERPPRQGGQQEAPLATVEFRAVLGDGTPVRDIEAGHVSLKVDGRERTLASLTLLEPGAGDPAASRPGTPPPFATNVSTGSFRDTMVLVDDESIPPGAEAGLQEAARQFVSSLAPADRAGVVSIPRGGVNLGPTVDRPAFAGAIAKVTGWAKREESDVEAACRTRTILGSLSNVFHDAAGGPPITMLFFSGGLTPPMTDGVSRMSTPAGLCEVRARDYRDVELDLLASPVTMYVVHVPDPATPGAAASFGPIAGLEHLAGVTGNRMVRLVGDRTAAISQLARENSVRYCAAFAPDESERDGQTHRVNVQVSRPGVNVMARPGVLIPASESRAAKKGPSPRDMLRVPRAFRDLPLRAAAFASRDDSADRVRVAVMFEPDGPAAPIAAAAIGLFDEKGKLVVQATAERSDLARAPALVGTVVKRGTYRMRVAATSKTGATGTVDSQVRLDLSSEGALALSSLVLGVMDEGRFTGRLQFADEPSAVAYLEIYGRSSGAVTAELELADTEDGPAGARGPMMVTRDEAGNRHVAMASIPIGSLPPGDIVVRVVVSVDGAPVGRATRTLRKTE